MIYCIFFVIIEVKFHRFDTVATIIIIIIKRQAKQNVCLVAINNYGENDVLFQKVTQAYSEKNPSAPIRSRT